MPISCGMVKSPARLRQRKPDAVAERISSRTVAASSIFSMSSCPDRVAPVSRYLGEGYMQYQLARIAMITGFMAAAYPARAKSLR